MHSVRGNRHACAMLHVSMGFLQAIIVYWGHATMNEKNLIKFVSKVFPWLAPLPNAYFVGRSVIAHLAVPWWMGVICAGIIEFLGLATMNTASWLYDWNVKKRKSDPVAPTKIAIALGGVYLLATIGLTVVLEIVPVLSTLSLALFPFLALVGFANLALISQQENREQTIAQDKAQKSAQRSAQRQAHHGATNSAQNGEISHNIDAINKRRRAQKSALIEQLICAYQGNPNLGPTEAGKLIGVHRNTIYGYLVELQEQGRIKRNGDGVEVL